MKVVAILEIMWGERAGRAPRWFSINPDNASGRRLYKWVGDAELVVTNVCPQMMDSAKGRDTPDPVWLKENLERLRPYDLVLACGSVVARHLDPAWCGGARVLWLPHPAFRGWTRSALEVVGVEIRNGAGNKWMVGEVFMDMEVT